MNLSRDGIFFGVRSEIEAQKLLLRPVDKLSSCWFPVAEGPAIWHQLAKRAGNVYSDVHDAGPLIPQSGAQGGAASFILRFRKEACLKLLQGDKW